MNQLNLRWYAYFPAIVALLASVFPFFAEAQIVVRTGENISVNSEQVVEGNFYSLGSGVAVSGEVTGDWLAAGGKVTGNGEYGEDVMILAGTANLHGSTTGDVRIVAGDAVIADFVGGNLTVMAGSVKVLSSATITGDILMYSGDVEIEGTVGGSILGRASRLRVDNQVGGDIDVTVQSITLGNRAVIEGSVLYTSVAELVRAQDAEVVGSVTKREAAPNVSYRDMAQNLLTPLLLVLFTSLTFFLLVRRRFASVVSLTAARPLFMGMIGAAVVLATPFVITLFIVSILGSLLGVILLTLYVLLIVLGIAISGPLLGVLVGTYGFKRPQLDLLSIGLGCVGLYLLVLIPYLGILLVLMLVFVSIGGLCVRLYDQ